MRSVVSNDADHSAPSLSKYYQAKGTPLGRWLGSGLAGFNSEKITTGAVIDGEQMAALYGEGLHPETNQMMWDGKTIAQCQIGRAFPTYTGGDKVLEAVRNAEAEFKQTTKKIPTSERRSEIALRVGRPLFVEENGTEPVNDREVLRWINAKKDSVKQPVAGFDFTFSPAKSISAVWALADEATAKRIEDLHHKAVAETLAWAEDNVVRTRVGRQGIKQVKTKGLIATEFTHFDTRNGDPDLHSHVLLANRVQVAEGDDKGKWLSLDSRTLHRHHQTLSWRYDNVLQDLLTREMGLEFHANERGDGKQPVWEVAGVDHRLLDLFASRRAGARPVFDRKVKEFIDATGSTPSKRKTHELWQEAILETRDAKKPAEALATLRQTWAAQVAEHSDGQRLVQSVQDALSPRRHVEHTRPFYDAEEHSAALKTAVLDTVANRRSTFRRSHIMTAVAGHLNAYRFTDGQRDTVHEQITREIINEFALPINTAEPLNVPDALRNEQGVAIDRHLDFDQYTTAEILSAEQKVIDAAGETVPVFVAHEDCDEAFDIHERTNGWSLNDGQQALARHLLTAGTVVASGVGPAGTGKTASMKLVVDTWKRTRGNVIALAPSAAAADVLGDDTGAQAHTIDSLTFTWMGKHPTKPGRDLSALDVEINEGDMILVDEAGMASTPNMAALVDIAHEAGAVVRFVGDHKQLSAVENGGLFGALVRSTPTAELTQVMRFGDDQHQAEASMRIRQGDITGLDLYQSRGWITSGQRADLLNNAAEAHLADRSAGRKSMIIAAKNSDVDALNAMIRAELVSNGEVDTTTEVTGVRGEAMGLGDTVIARKNTRFNPDRDGVGGAVVNGDMFTITGIFDDGSLEVTHQTKKTTQVLPAAYVDSNVHLGYAATVHRAQGATVDVARCIVDSSMDSASLYVGLTRGKHANYAYVATDPEPDISAEDGHMHHSGDTPAPTARQILERIITRDTRELSATEAMARHREEADSPQRLDALWDYAREEAIKGYIDDVLPRWIDALPAYTSARLEASTDGDAPIRAAMRELIIAGKSPDDILPLAFHHSDEAEDVGRLISWRIRQHISADAKRDGLPPVLPGSDMELATWLETNHPANRPVTLPPGPELVAGATYKGQDFSGMDFTGRNLKRVTFTNCDFTGASFASSSFDDVQFQDC